MLQHSQEHITTSKITRWQLKFHLVQLLGGSISTFQTVMGWVLTSFTNTWQSQRKHRKLDPSTCKASCTHLRCLFPKKTLLHLFRPWSSEGHRLRRTIIERKYKLEKGWDGKVPKALFLARNFPWIQHLQGRNNIYHCQIPFPKQAARISQDNCRV